MISYLRLFLNAASGITSVLVYVTLIIEFIFLLSMVTFDRLVDIHYYLFLMIFFDSIIRLIIRPSKVFGYRRLMLGFLSVFPILEYNGVQFFDFQLSLGGQQVILFFIAASRLKHLSFLLSNKGKPE